MDNYSIKTLLALGRLAAGSFVKTGSGKRFRPDVGTFRRRQAFSFAIVGFLVKFRSNVAKNCSSICSGVLLICFASLRYLNLEMTKYFLKRISYSKTLMNGFFLSIALSWLNLSVGFTFFLMLW